MNGRKKMFAARKTGGKKIPTTKPNGKGIEEEIPKRKQNKKDEAERKGPALPAEQKG